MDRHGRRPAVNCTLEGTSDVSDSVGLPFGASVSSRRLPWIPIQSVGPHGIFVDRILDNSTLSKSPSRPGLFLKARTVAESLGEVEGEPVEIWRNLALSLEARLGRIVGVEGAEPRLGMHHDGRK